MALLKSYSCVKCGGVLIFDSDQEFFDCPFCGTKYNVADFHGNEILDQAQACLRQQSYDAAKEKFNAVLDNESDSFDALLGLVLCELKVSSVEDLKDHKVLNNKDLTNAKKALINAKRQLPKIEAAYFNKIADLVNIKEKINRYENEKNELLNSEETHNTLHRKMLRDHQDKRSDNRTEILNGFPVFLFMLPFFIVILLIENPAHMIAAFVVLIVIVILVIVGINRYDALEDANYNPTLNVQRNIEGDLIDFEKEYDLEFLKLSGLYPADTGNKKIESDQAEPEEAFSIADSDLNPSETVTCSKCAAKLILDKNKRIYQCDHCGVAYGVSLFFGMPMEKALNSLNSGCYGDAGKRFSSILMMHPSDFEANLGYILCEGKWTKISDMDLTDEMSPSRLTEIKTRLDEAKQHISSDNQPYFENLEKLVSLFEDYSANTEKVDAVNAKLAAFEARTEVYSVAFSGSDFIKKNEAERKEILTEAYPYLAKIKKLRIDFKELRQSIIDMRSDCVLCR